MARLLRYPPSMFIAAALVGLVTAYYFGLRTGWIAAAATLALFVAAVFMPGRALYFYGAVLAGLGGVLVVGPRLPSRENHRQDLVGAAQRGLRKALLFVQRNRKK